jgi:hypothetical protein
MSHTTLPLDLVNEELNYLLITADTNKTAATVLKLVQPLLKHSQTVRLDNILRPAETLENFCNLHCLAKTLDTLCVSTLKLSQRKCYKESETLN